MRKLAILFFFVAITARAQWTSIGDMPAPTRDGNSLRFRNAQATATVTVLSPEVIRVRITHGAEPRDHSYAVVSRDFGAVNATITNSTITTGALTVTIKQSPFRMSFATSSGQSLDEDREIAFNGTTSRISKRLRDDEHIYALGEKTGPLDKRGWKNGGFSYTMWNSDTFAYDSATDPIYVSVPFYIDLRKGVAFGIFLDNTFRSNFDIGHQSEGVLSFGADGGALDYYFIYGPAPKKVIERYTTLTGRTPLPPMWSLGFHQCRYSYFPESRVRFIAENFRERKIPADTIWLDIHYQDSYKPFTWDRERFPDPAKMIGDLRKQGFHLVTIVDPHPKKEKGYAPYDSGIAGDHFVKKPDGSVYEAPVWPSQAEKNPGPSVFPDFSRAATRAWWGSLYAGLVSMGVAGIWNDMNEPAIFDVPSGTMPLDNRHDNEGAPTDHREIHNVYGMLMTRSTYEGLLKLRPAERPFVLSRASYAGGQRYSALWPGDNVSEWNHLRQSIPTLLGLGLSGYSFVGSDIGGFAEAPTAELFTRWLQVGVFYPFMRDHSMYGSPDQEPWAFGPQYEAINRRAIELRYQLLPHIYSVMREAAETGVPAMRPMMLEFPEDERTYGMDDQFLFGSDILVAPALRAEISQRPVYLPAGEWFNYWTGEKITGGKWIDVPLTLSTIPIFIRGGAFVFSQPVVQHTGEMPGQPLNVFIYPSGPSERTFYEDDGASFDYKRGVFARRKFSVRMDGNATVVEISAPEGTYRPAPRDIVLMMRGTASRVSVGEMTSKDGVVMVRLPDRFEKTVIRIDR